MEKEVRHSTSMQRRVALVFCAFIAGRVVQPWEQIKTKLAGIPVSKTDLVFGALLVAEHLPGFARLGQLQSHAALPGFRPNHIDQDGGLELI